MAGYGRMAEAHWRKYLPRLVEKLEANGQLKERLFEAEEKTKEEMKEMIRRLMKRSKYTPAASRGYRLGAAA